MTIRDNYWANDDGLVIGFGTNKPATGVTSKVGVAGYTGELHLDIVAKDLLAVGSLSVGDYQGAARLPDDVYIVSVDLYVETLFAGSSGVLDVGTFGWTTGGAGTVNTLTTIDVDGLVQAEVISGKLGVVGIVAPTNAAGQLDTIVDGSGSNIIIAPTLKSGSFSAGKATLVIKYKQ
jgi:hypothetical protein